MASSLFFNGRLTSLPGAYSAVDATGLQRVGFGASGVVAVVGEAEGGVPHTEFAPGDEIPSISNPAKIPRTYRSGDLLEAGAMLFDPSKDSQIQSGAQALKFVKVNPATRSSIDLAGDPSGLSMRVTSRDYGQFTTQISIDVADGTNQGKSVTVAFESITEVFDDVGGVAVFTMLYAPAANGADTMTMALSPVTGLLGEYRKNAPSSIADYNGASLGSGLLADLITPITPTAAVRVASSAAGDTTQSITVYGLDAANAPQTEVIGPLTGVTPVSGASTWNRVDGFLLDAAAVGTVLLEEDAGGFPDLYSVAPAALSAGIKVLSALESASAIVSLVLDGAGVHDVILFGTDESDVAQAEEITTSGVTPSPTSALWNRIDVITASQVPGGLAMTLSGLVWNLGDVVRIVSNSAGDTTQNATIYGLDNAGAVQTEVLALNGTTPVPGTATWSRVMAISLDNATSGTVISVTDPTGAFVQVFVFDGSATQTQGITLVERIEPEGDLVEAESGNALAIEDVLIIGTTTAQVAQVEKITLAGLTPVSGVLPFGSITGIVTSHALAGSVVAVDGEINLPIAGFDTIQKVADKMNAKTGWTVGIGVSNPAEFLISAVDPQPAISVLTAVNFLSDRFAVLNVLNDASSLVFAESLDPNGYPPANTAAPVFLIGGVEGATSFSDWQASIDILRDNEVNTIVPLTDDPAVHAALVSHCVFMNGPGKKERDCVLGAPSGDTLTQLKAAALALNTRHARLVYQDHTRFDALGASTVFPPYFTACLAAGMQAGSPPGTSLTFKFINLLEITNAADFNTVDDGNTIIDAGLCAIERVPNRGFRWLRNITTHLLDDNPAFTEAHVNEAANFATRQIRDRMEFFVGQPSFEGTLGSALAALLQVCSELVAEPVITNFRNITLELTGDVLTIDLEIAPLQSVNFVPITVHLVNTSLAAAA